MWNCPWLCWTSFWEATCDNHHCVWCISLDLRTSRSWFGFTQTQTLSQRSLCTWFILQVATGCPRSGRGRMAWGKHSVHVCCRVGDRMGSWGSIWMGVSESQCSTYLRIIQQRSREAAVSAHLLTRGRSISSQKEECQDTWSVCMFDLQTLISMTRHPCISVWAIWKLRTNL